MLFFPFDGEREKIVAGTTFLEHRGMLVSVIAPYPQSSCEETHQPSLCYLMCRTHTLSFIFQYRAEVQSIYESML